MKCCHSTGRACWGIGAILSSLVWLLIAIFVPGFIDQKIVDGVKDMVLATPKAQRENGVGWQQFTDNSKPSSNALYQEFTFWNCTNPHDVMQGAKAKIVEIGPYVYRANQRRVNATFYTDRDGNKQVQFKMYRWFTFERSMTAPDLNPLTDLITSANLMFKATELQDLELVWNIYSDEDRFDDYSRLFATRKVTWWIFGGQSFDIPFMQFPGMITNDTLESIAKDGYCSQYTGEDHLFQANMLTKWKGHTSIVYNNLPLPLVGDWVQPWATSMANRLHGTSGDAFAPLNSFEKGGTIPVYVDDMYMEVPLVNLKNEIVTVKGVDLIKFSMTKHQLQNSINNPLNKPYYMDGPNGFFNLTNPRLAPLFASMAHFLYVDQDVQDLVEGCHPDEAKHSTWLGVEPWTGMTLTAQKTYQVNSPMYAMNMSAWDGPVWFPNVTKGLYLPVAWIKYGGTMTDDIASTIKGQVYMGVAARSVMKWAGFGMGLFLLAVGLFLLLSAMKELRKEHMGKSRVVTSRSNPHRAYRQVSEG